MTGLSKPSVALIPNVQHAVRSNITRLLKVLGVRSDLVYKKLNPLDFEHYLIQQKRAERLRQYNGNTPLSFMKALYQRSHSMPGNTSRMGISLKRLFQEYEQITIRNIEPEHLEDFIETMLDNRKFIRPLRLSIITDDPRVLVHGYFRLKKIRQSYLKQINQLFNDLKSYKLPLSIKEQNKLIFYTFFRDKLEIENSLNEILKKWKHSRIQVNDFTFKHYKNLKMNCTESFNNTMRICMMQQNHEIFKELEQKVQPDRETFKILLEAYSGVFKDKQQFENVISRIDVTMDITLLNLVMKGYIQLGDIERAEEVLETIELIPATDPLYHYITIEDKRKYDKYLKYYDNLSKFIEMVPIQIIPNIETFTPFVNYYTKVDKNKEKAFHLLRNMELIKLPLNTKIFEIVVGEFDDSSSIEILGMLLRLFERLYSNDADVVKHNEVPEEGGQLLKLRDSLVSKLSKSLSTLDKRINELFSELKTSIRDIRRNNEYNDLFIKNEIIYRKWCYLKEIYRIVEEIEYNSK